MSKTSPRVVITGASSGFGEGAVQAFADRGWLVWGTMRDVARRHASQRPVRTVVGIPWGADELNRLTRPLQDGILQQMQLEDVLGGTGA